MRAAWQVVTREPAQAGNRAGRTEHHLQWWDNSPERLAVTSVADKQRDSSLLSFSFLYFLQQICHASPLVPVRSACASLLFPSHSPAGKGRGHAAWATRSGGKVGDSDLRAAMYFEKPDLYVCNCTFVSRAYVEHTFSAFWL